MGFGGFFGGGNDNNDAEKEAKKAAEQARKSEAQRQADILAGRGKIDAAFKPFDDKFYSGVQKNYVGYYQPQLDRQYGDARDTTTGRLAVRGVDRSTYGAKTMSDLLYQRDTQGTAISDAGRGAAQDLRGQIESQRQSLYGQNQSAADPALAASNASASASVLQQPQVYSPLADVFGSFLGNVATGVAAERQGYRGLGTGYFGPSSRGSVAVVR